MGWPADPAPVAAGATAIAGVVATSLLLFPSWWIRTLLQRLFPAVLFCGSPRRRQVALTFDDGPSGPDSLRLLDLLEELGVRATFFVISGHLEGSAAEFARRAVVDGHQLGNHLCRDGFSVWLGAAEFERQLLEAERVMSRAGGGADSPPRWCRPGGGWFTPAMLRIAARHGYRLALGSVWPWDTFHPPLALQRWFVLANVHPGAIVVLHDRSDTIGTTLASVRRLVPELRGRGYSFCSLQELSEA